MCCWRAQELSAVNAASTEPLSQLLIDFADLNKQYQAGLAELQAVEQEPVDGDRFAAAVGPFFAEVKEVRPAVVGWFAVLCFAARIHV